MACYGRKSKFADARSSNVWADPPTPGWGYGYGRGWINPTRTRTLLYPAATGTRVRQPVTIPRQNASLLTGFQTLMPHTPTLTLNHSQPVQYTTFSCPFMHLADDYLPISSYSEYLYLAHFIFYLYIPHCIFTHKNYHRLV